MASLDEIQTKATEFARGFDYKYYWPLHVALLKGDWVSVSEFLGDHPDALTAKITTLAMTPIHVAAVGGQWQLVERLVERLSAEALAVTDLVGCTALHYVAMGGSTRAAKAVVKKNPSLTGMTNLSGHTPLMYAIIHTRRKDLVWYLTLATTSHNPNHPFTGPSAGDYVALLTAAGFHDMTLYLVERYPDLATVKNDKGSYILNVLSKMPTDFPSGSKLGLWGRCIYQIVPAEHGLSPPYYSMDCSGDAHVSQFQFGSLVWKAIGKLVPVIRNVQEIKLRHMYATRLVESLCEKASNMNDSEFWIALVPKRILSNAASSGIVEILRICFLHYPDLVWLHEPNEGYIVQDAIRSRQGKVFSLLCKIPMCKNFISWIDDSNNTSSHLAAVLAPSPQLESVSGAALQMQRELQWFKEVEKLDHPLYKEFENNDGKTPWELFREEHKSLLAEGEKWMKDTSNSCMLVATLIATVVFAGAFTVPGGNDSNKGIPIFLMDKTFMVFAISDALGLFSSITSLLMFLAILTARYAEEDFLRRLPKRLILGLASLFLAIVTTMIAFGASLTIVLGDRLKWVYVPIIVLGSLPVTSFALHQLPLFFQMIQLTYGSGIYEDQTLW